MLHYKLVGSEASRDFIHIAGMMEILEQQRGTPDSFDAEGQSEINYTYLRLLSVCSTYAKMLRAVFHEKPETLTAIESWIDATNLISADQKQGWHALIDGHGGLEKFYEVSMKSVISHAELEMNRLSGTNITNEPEMSRRDFSTACGFYAGALAFGAFTMNGLLAGAALLAMTSSCY